MRRQLELADEVATELAGPRDAVMKTLEEHLGCEVFLRGNVLTLDGEEDDVQAGAEVVREVSDLVRQGHEIAPGTITAVTRALDQHASPAEILDDVVWRHRSRKVAPKTVNQKRYVDAIRRSTITFGVGPAGTGKTFLAIAMAVAAAAQRGRDLVGDLDLAAHQRSASWTSAETRLPSARPPTFGIAAFMTWPMSFGELAPVSATAPVTISRSSSSDSSAGR